MTAETAAERHVWDLLTRDFYWQLPADFAVKLYAATGAEGPARLQLFEIAVAAIFARLRPEYEWYVTPNRPDGGLDFVGRHGFLRDEALGIAAAITVGGQCKKRTRVNDVVSEVAGSLARMAATVNPTFFVVALSARLNRERVVVARQILERTHQRHCHILDRAQIEGLMQEHLPSLERILREGLTDEELRDVVAYFESPHAAFPPLDVDLEAPKRVLAGVPFTVSVSVRSASASPTGSRLWWSQHSDAAAEVAPVTLIGPLGADGPAGAALAAADDPFRSGLTIEFVTYGAGTADLGEVLIGRAAAGANATQPVALGRVRVVENLTPRFFDRPLRGALTRLASEYERALAGGVASIGVVGAGGSGKSRVCQEFALERRRRGATVLAASQAKTPDDPHRILADLFYGLAVGEAAALDPADRVISAIERYDRPLAARAESAIRSIFGISAGSSGTVADQSVLSSLVLLAVTQARRAPLIVHCQELHWCPADVLLLLEKLVWQLDHVLAARDMPPRSAESGVLFVFEGRIRERHELGGPTWISEPFERFLQKLDSTTVRCASFSPEDGLEFVRRLFEDRYSARRLVNEDLLGLQSELVEQIDRSAGGNPFHSLEQVQLLKERGVVGLNPQTGLLYMIQPAPSASLLPASVFEAIELRWRYLRERRPELALLVWATALIDDRVSAPLFRRLWRELAPTASLGDVDGTDILWTGGSESHEVGFRHENYFRSIRRFEVAAEDRRRAVEVYVQWFEEAERREPLDQFRWARVLLELPEPGVTRAKALMDAALSGAREAGDVRLAKQILVASLDLAWNEDARSPVEATEFVRRCAEELALVRELLGSDRAQATERLEAVRRRLTRRVTGGARTQPLGTLVELQRAQLRADVLRAQILYNDRRPVMAAEIAARAVEGIRALRSHSATDDDPSWNALEMDALHARAVALALSGEIDEALPIAERAVQIARRSSSSRSQRVISSYANILLARDPGTSESLLRECLADIGESDELREPRENVEINLSMALVLRAYRVGLNDEEARASLAEARRRLSSVFSGSFQVGRFANAAASALLLGIVSALERSGEEVSWFAQAVAAAARGHKTETLWRAHINLATALSRQEGAVTQSVRDHAHAALQILEETLSPYSQPDRSARFDLIRVPLAQAARFLVIAGDDAGHRALVRYPSLRRSFEDPETGVLRQDRGAHRIHEWLRIGDDDYVIY